LYEIIGFDGVIKPFLDKKNTDDIMATIDSIAKSEGAGKDILIFWDNYFLQSETKNSFLCQTQIKLIKLFFQKLTADIGNENIETIIQNAYDFQYLLITSPIVENLNDGRTYYHKNDLDLDKVQTYYKLKLEEFMADLCQIDPDYANKTIETEYSEEKYQEYQNKHYIYLGDYAHEYRIYESFNQETNMTTVEIIKHYIPVICAKADESAICIKETVNGAQKEYELIFSDINQHLYYDLIKDKPQLTKLVLNIDANGNVEVQVGNSDWSD